MAFATGDLPLTVSVKELLAARAARIGAQGTFVDANVLARPAETVG